MILAARSGLTMDAPRILAIADVHLLAPAGAAERVRAFYGDLLGFEAVPGVGEQGLVGEFRGWPSHGPRLIVWAVPAPAGPPRAGRLLVEVSSLTACAEAMAMGRVDYEWSHGWSFFDQRLTTRDPAGNRVELVAYHRL